MRGKGTSMVARFRGTAVRVVVPESAPTQVLGNLGVAAAPAEVVADAEDGPVASGTVEVHRSGPGWSIVRDDAHAWSGTDPGELARRLASEVHLSLASHATDLVFVHAGCVGWRGQAVLVPGRSGTGKSTLVHALLSAGAEYLSDEYALLDVAGLVHPFARRLTMRTETGVEHLDPAARWPVAPGAHRVAVVLEAPYDRGAAWLPERTTGAAVVLPLVANAVAARLWPERVLDHAAAVAASGAELLSGPRGDAAAVAPLVLAAVDAHLREG